MCWATRSWRSCRPASWRQCTCCHRRTGCRAVRSNGREIWVQRRARRNLVRGVANPVGSRNDLAAPPALCPAFACWPNGCPVHHGRRSDRVAAPPRANATGLGEVSGIAANATDLISWKVVTKTKVDENAKRQHMIVQGTRTRVVVLSNTFDVWSRQQLPTIRNAEGRIANRVSHGTLPTHLQPRPRNPEAPEAFRIWDFQWNPWIHARTHPGQIRMPANHLRAL